MNNLIRCFFLGLMIILFSNYLCAQKKTAKNSIYVEGWNRLDLFSIHYDRIFVYKPLFKLSSSVGFAFSVVGNHRGPAFPLGINFLIGNQHYLETGLEAKYILGRQRISETDFSNYYSTFYFRGMIGYRYQKTKRGFFTKVGFVPIVVHYSRKKIRKPKVSQWGKIGIGYSF